MKRWMRRMATEAKAPCDSARGQARHLANRCRDPGWTVHAVTSESVILHNHTKHRLWPDDVPWVEVVDVRLFNDFAEELQRGRHGSGPVHLEVSEERQRELNDALLKLLDPDAEAGSEDVA